MGKNDSGISVKKRKEKSDREKKEESRHGITIYLLFGIKFSLKRTNFAF